jgi:uncharacterized protein
MNHSKRESLTWLLIVAAIISTVGCSVLSPQEDQSRYFVLTRAANNTSITPAAVSNGSRELTIGLGPISIPRYLARPEIVTRLSDTEVSVSDTDRWGEPLDASATRVLGQDLSSDLPNSQIVSFPWSRKTKIDYRVSVDFQRLEKTADGKAEVQATWKVRTGVDNRLVQTGTTTAIGSAGNDQSSASASLSQGIAQVSREIAQAIQKQPQLMQTATQNRSRS